VGADAAVDRVGEALGERVTGGGAGGRAGAARRRPGEVLVEHAGEHLLAAAAADDALVLRDGLAHGLEELLAKRPVSWRAAWRSLGSSAEAASPAPATARGDGRPSIRVTGR
jgi:hypothetical protein